MKNMTKYQGLVIILLLTVLFTPYLSYADKNNDKLISEAKAGNIEKIKDLVAKGADVNAKENNGSTVLMDAASEGHLEVVRYLIDKGADVNTTNRYGWTALMSAAVKGHLEVVESLIDNGADVNAKHQKGWTALMLAEYQGNWEVANSLIDGNADVNARNDDDDTVLIFAAMNGHLEVVKSLIAKGVDVNARNITGWTALMLAVRNGRLGVIELLIAEGADVNAKSNDGSTALIFTASNGRIEVVKYLIAKGADVNASNNDNKTALMRFAEFGHLDAVKYLIVKGADVNAKSNDGSTALDIAKAEKHNEIINVLESAMNKPVGLKIYTEAYPPLNFVEKGKVTGLSTDVVRELIKRTRTRADIQLVTWEKGYKAAMEKPNAALFSVAMTPERKPLLQWVGPIVFLNANFYAKKGSKFGIKLLEDTKKLPKIVVVKDYYTEQLLRKEGFSNLESVATEEIAIQKLLKGEAQLFPSNNITMPALLKRVNATMGDVESVLNLSTNMIYVAFSKGTSPKLIALWQKKLDEMKTDGTFSKIYAKWLPAETPPGIIQMMTEEYPPVTFMKNGKVSGFVTDIVREISFRQGIQDNIRLTSWDEAYKVALSNPNVVLFSCERTNEREKLFQWVGPVGKNSAIFYVKKGSGIKIKSFEDAKKVAAIATTANWFTEQDLKGRGFTNLVSSPLPTDNVRKLMKGEVQLSIFTDITIPEIVKNAGYNMDDLEPVFTVSDTYFYIAMSLGTPPEMVKKWQSVLDELKKDGTFEKIYRSYIPNADLNNLLGK